MASFYDLLHKVTGLLESEGRVSYRAIKREFDIDDEVLEDLKTELVKVKQIARDIDGKVLELIAAGDQAIATGPSGPAVQRKPRGTIQVADSIVAPSPESIERPAGPARADAVDSQSKQRPVKRTFLIWLGAACILVGVLLPWATARIDMQGFVTQRRSATGLDLSQGLLSIAVGVFGSVMGFLAARRTIPARVVALSIIVTGIVVLGVTADVITGLSSNDFGLPGVGSVMSVRQNPEPGVFITLLGGFFLSLGGLIALARAKKQKT